MCGPEFLDLEAAIRQPYPVETVQVFGLSSGGESAQDLEIFARAFQVSFPILPGAYYTYSSYRQNGNTSPYPLDYVIDQAGNVAYHATEYDPELMIAVIDHLLLNPAPVGETPAARRPLRIEGRPNPFNPRTEIRFELDRPARVTVDIHDARGRLVRRLQAGVLHEAGPRSVTWDGTDGRGRHLPAGIYLAHVTADDRTATAKLTLVK